MIMKSIRIIKDKQLNKVSFFLNGDKVYPVHIKGNLYTFENGETIIL